MTQLIYDTFTGSGGTTLAAHDGEVGADWSQFFLFGDGLASFVLDGAGALRGASANKFGAFAGSAVIPADVATYYEAVFTINALDNVAGSPEIVLLASSNAVVSSSWNNLIGFSVDIQDYGSGNFKALLYARRSGFSADLNFVEADTGVARATGTYTVRVEIPAARDRLKVLFNGSTIYDAALPAALDQFVYGGFGYGLTSFSNNHWVVSSVEVGYPGAPPPPPPLPPPGTSVFWTDFTGSYEVP